MRLSRTLLLSILILCQFQLFSQFSDSTKNVSLSLKSSKGFIYPHHESFKYLVEDYTSAFDINLSKEVSGEKIWHQLYKNPTVGIGYYYTDFGNTKQLGHANAVYSFITIPILENRTLKLSSRYGAGIAWLSKRFDLQDNNYNIAIGSNLNAYLNLNLDFDIRFFTNRIFL